MFRYSVYLIIMLLTSSKMVFADNLKIYGFFQTFYRNTVSVDENITERFDAIISQEGYHTYGIQQMNVMASNKFGSGLNAFMNISMTDNLDIDNNFGNITIQELFLKWKNSNGTINVKFGSFLPQFNSFLEVINKFPAIPFILRPFIYESNFYSYFNPDDLHPWKGNFQVYGKIPASEIFTIEYAIFHANPELEFMNQSTGINQGGGGYNQSSNSLIGGRVGFNSFSDIGFLRVGTSLVFDEDNQTNTTIGGWSPDELDLGLIPRNMIGLDLSYQIGDFSFNGEAIFVTNNPNSSQKNALANVLNTYGVKEDNFEKRFFYGTAQYTFLDQISVYGMYANFEDHAIPSLSNGMSQYAAGLNWAWTAEVVLKLQFNNIFIDDQQIDPTAPMQLLNGLELNQSNILFAVSVLF